MEFGWPIDKEGGGDQQVTKEGEGDFQYSVPPFPGVSATNRMDKLIR